MAEGIELALGAMICYGIVDWVYKRAAAAAVPAHQMMMTQAFFFAPGIFLYGLATDTLAFGVPFVWGVGAGVFIFVALYNFNRSLATGAVSVVAPVFRLSFAITATLAVGILDEPIGAWKAAGLGLALAAVWLLLGGRDVDRRSAPRPPLQALIRVLVATIAMGIVSFFYKLGALAGGSPATVLAGQASTFAPLAIVFATARDRGLVVPRAAWTHAATTALLLLVGVIMLITGLRRGEASTLVPIAQLSFVITAGLGLTLQHESSSPRKTCGLACAVAALLCLAQS